MINEKPSLGFIGLGLMGQAFTRRLTDCDYTVTGYDIDKSKIDLAAQHGVKSADSPAAVAAVSDIVLICVTSTQHVAAR